MVDCAADTYLIDADAIERAITKRTRAVIPVHLYGQPVDIDPILEVAAEHGIQIVEDAAQAHGAAWKDGRRCGTVGVAAGFSFYPGKNLGAYGDGGAITTNDDEIAGHLRLLRNWGSEVKYFHDIKSVQFTPRHASGRGPWGEVKIPGTVEHRAQCCGAAI